MADNVQAGAAVGSGPIFATANLTFSGDSVQVPGGFSGILSGSEGAWTWTLVVGGAGAVTAGVQRVTLASDDPAVVALQVIDDWDESDRAKVNLIAGQAGIAGGAGVVGATVPRVTLASDDPAVVALQLIDNAISGAGFNITQFGGASVPLGAGVEGTALRVTVATDSTGVLSVDDNGGSLTIDNATLSVVGSGLEATALRVTIASDSTGVLSVDDNGGAITVDNGGTFAVQVDGAALTALQLIDNLVLAEDAVHNSGDPGVMALAIQKSADAGLAADGDYVPLQTDANGYLKVNIKAGAGSGGTASTDDAAFTAAAGSGTPMMGFVTADAVDSGDVGVVGMLANRQLKVTLYDSGGVELAVGGGTQYTEDAAAAANPVGNAINLVRADSLAAVTDANGDNVAARGTNNGELYVKHVDAIPVTDNGGALTVDGSLTSVGTVTTVSTVTTITNVVHVDDNSGSLTVDGTVTATIAAGATTIAKAEDAAHTTGDVGVMALSVRQDTAAALAGTDADYQPLITDANGRLHVIAAIAATQTLATVTTVSTLTGGGVAHDSADSGNPVKIGAIATASLLGRTPVAAADRTDLVAGTDGALIVRNGTSLEDIISEQKTNTDGASTAMTGAFAATASQRIYLTDLIMANSSATNITVDIRDGSAGSVLATFPVPANGGVVHRFGTPLRFTANTAAAFDGSAAATTLSVTMIGFKSKT